MTAFSPAIGAAGSYLYQTTGAAVALHEVVGHGILGMRLTSDYPHGTGPHYWIAGFDEFHKIEHATSPIDGIQKSCSWLFIDHSKNGVDGYASQGPDYHPNALAKYLGPYGTEAWISITGSIPGLVVNTACVATGMFLRHKYPSLSLGLIFFGFTNSLIDSAYAWSAACMSSSELQYNAATGHDFANFAIQMQHITGVHATLISLSVALFWTGLIPLVALGIYFYQNSHQIDWVSNQLAVKYWLTQCFKNEEDTKVFNQLWQAYQHERTNNPIAANVNPNDCLNDPCFIQYLINNMPKSMLLDTKKAFLTAWQPLQAPSKLESTLAYATLSTVIIGVISQVLMIFAETIAPYLLLPAQILQSLMPILSVISIANALYETQKDLLCPDFHVPLLAKALSCFKLFVTVAMVVSMIVATFVPGMQLLFLPAVFLGTLLTLSLSFAKNKVIQNAFKASALQMDTIPSCPIAIQQPSNEAHDELESCDHSFRVA